MYLLHCRQILYHWATREAIIAYGDYSHEIKRCLLLGKKPTTNLDNVLKSRDIILPTKVCVVKALYFPVVTYGCASWTIKKAECQRIDVCELWDWRRLLRVPWAARRSNQSFLKEINISFISWIFIGRAEAKAEAPIFWPPGVKSKFIGKDPDAGKDWRQKEKRVVEDEIVR